MQFPFRLTDRKDRSYIGAGINYRSDVDAVGINVKYGLRVVGNLTLEPNFNYFIKKDYTLWDINLDAKYDFNVTDRFRLYPVAGILYSYYKWDGGSGSDGDCIVTGDSKKWGAGFGAGASYDISPNLFLNIDPQVPQH